MQKDAEKKDQRLYWQKLEEALTDILNSVEVEGCEGCATVSFESVNKGRKALGWKPLPSH